MGTSFLVKIGTIHLINFNKPFTYVFLHFYKNDGLLLESFKNTEVIYQHMPLLRL